MCFCCCFLWAGCTALPVLSRLDLGWRDRESVCCLAALSQVCAVLDKLPTEATLDQVSRLLRCCWHDCSALCCALRSLWFIIGAGPGCRE